MSENLGLYEYLWPGSVFVNPIIWYNNMSLSLKSQFCLIYYDRKIFEVISD